MHFRKARIGVMTFQI